MTDYDKYRGSIHTSKGGWQVGSGIATHGYSLLDDIHGQCSVFQVIVLNVTGRLPERRLADFLEGLFICLSWPDARIWCNKIGAFSAMTRSTATAAVAAGGLAGNSTMYGPGTVPAVDGFLRSAHQFVVKDGGSIEDFISKHGYRGGRLYAPGFSRPLARGDKRIERMRDYAAELGYETGTYETLANDIAAHLGEREGEDLNLSGYFTAFMYDRGYSMQELMGITAWCISTGVYAAYFEQISRPPEAFLSLRVSDINYTGPGPREVPERD